MKDDGVLVMGTRLFVLLNEGLKKEILDIMHPSGTKMYHTLLEY